MRKPAKVQRVDGRKASPGAGTGIGLAAVRQIVELHGGTIGAESHEGSGCTFTLRLPIGATISAPGA